MSDQNYNDYTQNGILNDQNLNGGYSAPVSNGSYNDQSLNGGYNASVPNGSYNAQNPNGGYGVPVSNGSYNDQSLNGGYNASVPNDSYNAQNPNNGYNVPMPNGSFNVQNPNGGYYQPVQGVEQPGKGAATGSLVCGIISVVMVSLLFGIIGLVLSTKAKNAGYIGGIRTAGFVLSVLGTVFGAIVVVLFMCSEMIVNM